VTKLWFEQLEPDECIHLRLRERHRYDPGAAALPRAVAPGPVSGGLRCTGVASLMSNRW
jgi:hypothetical protein